MKPEPSALRKQLTLGVLLVAEVALGTVTIISALQANSAVLYTNAARVGSDVLVCLVSLLVVRMVGRRHAHFDYGLGKMENLAVLFTTAAMGFALVLIVQRAVDGLANPRPLERTELGLWALGAAFILNIAAYVQILRLRRRDASPVLEGQSHLYRNALIATLFSLIAVLAGTYSGGRHEWMLLLDPIAGLLLAGLVVQSTWRLARRSLLGLLDATVDERFQQAINRELIRHIKNYEQLHGVRARHSGARVRVELFLEFSSALPSGEVLTRCKALKSDLEASIPQSEVWVVPCDHAPSAV